MRENNLDWGLKGIKVCYFGHYDSNYSRNRILIKALRYAGASITQITDQRSFIYRSCGLTTKSFRNNFDLIVVGFPGHTDMPIAKLISLAKNTPLVFDSFISLYDSNIEDRKVFSANSLEANLYFTIDKIACTLADRILLDTNSHISYFIDTFKLPRAKFSRIWVGADTDIMHPYPEIKENDEFTIFFYGSFIPLHGIEYIIEAAKILEEQKQQVKFILVGTGQTYKSMHKKAENLRVRTIKFIGRVPYEDLPLIMAKSHICLGIFGTTSKAQRVIPNKVFDALAVSKPTITADTPAIKECLLHGKNIWLCPAGNSFAIAEAIITLKNNNCLRRNIGRNGYLRFKEIGSVDIIANQISLLIKEILNSEKK